MWRNMRFTGRAFAAQMLATGVRRKMRSGNAGTLRRYADLEGRLNGRASVWVYLQPLRHGPSVGSTAKLLMAFGSHRVARLLVSAS